MQPFLEGKVILINKPLHWTSFDAVKKIRIATQVAKVGHAGTLDPLATGLLIICTGKFTKNILTYMGMPKTYIATMTIGAQTPTYDLESEPGFFQDYSHITQEKIVAVFKNFTGEIMQVPPIHSAIKKDGEKAYIKARKGIDIKLEPRKITIFSLEILSINLPEISFEVVCSTGTYIRSLVHDMGIALGTGAYLSKLCRTRIGTFTIDESCTPIEFEERIHRLKKASEG
ncbi:MAG: tRNA pseudouridine(55) synthase TruB [Bacteroidetes bacterium]|nr:tRNA pseudouridine(55) synthase TruB [Bacteroidota bacterium]